MKKLIGKGAPDPSLKETPRVKPKPRVQTATLHTGYHTHHDHYGISKQLNRKDDYIGEDEPLDGPSNSRTPKTCGVRVKTESAHEIL